MKSDNIKFELAKAVKELMIYKNLDRITVTEISKKANVTRQTFYRNFIDKYNLINWYFNVLAKQSFEEMGVSLTLKEGLIKKFEFIKNERIFFKQAFKSTDYNSILKYDYEYILEFYKNILEQNIVGNIPVVILFSLKLYCHGSISMTKEWSDAGMIESPESMANMLIEAMPDNLRIYLSEINPKI